MPTSGTSRATTSRCSGTSRTDCAAVGRDPDEIERSIHVRVDYDDLPATAAALQPLVDAGATHINLGLTYPYPAGIVARLADEVVVRGA